MTAVRALVVIAAVAALTACRTGARTQGTSGRGVAAMRSGSGTSLGTLGLDRTSAGVRITGRLTGLAPGDHGIHFHQAGRCETPDFASAGPHLNPAGARHGLQNSQGPHAGDLPNLAVSAAGEVVVDVVTPRVTLDSSAPGALFDADGTALVIHAAADDQRTDPAGNSGARIACGVVTRG